VFLDGKEDSTIKASERSLSGHSKNGQLEGVFEQPRGPLGPASQPCGPLMVMFSFHLLVHFLIGSILPVQDSFSFISSLCQGTPDRWAELPRLSPLLFSVPKVSSLAGGDQVYDKRSFFVTG